ncbi:tRNA-dihydrouridine(20) synthase [NAD(P)+] [Rhypophila decipiens]|uniref:tRNA-dihydrouridine(20) synthase [NAD(P)+] n=1 Tax=Rhypophila decipiens TaxID=261697 RepID=A0AAN7BBX3_9PEZI|nr:tRNA-dihydrouridine(20) synthase [NAD(P)+] [Rhypophila decipiens]
MQCFARRLFRAASAVITTNAIATEELVSGAKSATATTASAMAAVTTAESAGAAVNARKRGPIPPRGVDYRGKVVLAPMVRSGELPMRLLSLHYGADLVWGPETVDRSMIGTTRRINPHTNMIEYSRMPTNVVPHVTKESIIYRIDPVREAGKLVFQIGTADPDLAVQAAKIFAADVYGIDVNAGCPKPFSTHGGMGAALLRTPDKLVAILEALVREISPVFGIGISVKIRLLETAADTEALVRRLVATGITGLTVHCRTTPMRPREAAIRGQLKMIREVCHEAGVACVMNGDVESRDHAAVLMEEYGTDGAMIATSAEKNPSCFRTAQDGGLENWKEVVKHYLKFAMEVGNKVGNTKYSLGMLIEGKAPEMRLLSPPKCYTDLIKALGYADTVVDEGITMLEMARKTDQILEVGEFAPPPMPKAKKGKQQQNQNGTQVQGQKRKRTPSPGANAKVAAMKSGDKEAISEALRQAEETTAAAIPPAAATAAV